MCTKDEQRQKYVTWNIETEKLLFDHCYDVTNIRK